MKKLLLFLLLASACFGQDCPTPGSCTTFLRLYKPNSHEIAWGSKYNANADVLEKIFASLVADCRDSTHAVGWNATTKTLACQTLTGTGVWGSISGTLSGQSDLQSALNLKAPLISPVFTTPNLGTPAAVTLTNGTGLPESGVTSLTSDLALKAPLISPSFTTPALGAATGASVNWSGAASATNTYSNGRPYVDVKHPTYAALGDGSTDDIVAITAAVAAAKNLGSIGGTPQSAELFFPCGSYFISTPIILPRSTSNTLSNQVVNLRGESKSCVTITGTAGFPVNRALVEWDQSVSGRTMSQTIQGITFVEPAVDGVGSIHYQYSPTNSPASTSNATNERLERLTLKDIEFRGSNGFNPYHFYFEGDCFNCTIENVYWDDARASGGNFSGANNVYETIGIKTDTCYTSTAPSNETCGFLDGRIINVGHIGNRGGYTALFQGRLNRGVMESAFCNGVRGGFSNSHCFEFTNSYQSVLTNISTEGLGGAPEILCTNSVQLKFFNVGIGAPNNSGYGIGDGMDFVGCSQNQLWSTSANSSAQNAWAVQQTITSTSGLSGGSGYTSAPTWTSSGGSATQNASGRTTISGGAVASVIIDNAGNFQGTPTIVFSGGGGTGAAATAVMTNASVFMLKLDANSHQNVFYDLHQAGTADLSFSDLTTNFAQTCDQTSSACATYFTVGQQIGRTSTTAVTFATLPACSAGLEGTRRSVNDSSTTTGGATITGGSSGHVPAYCNGTNWVVD